jgi:hypothetical protein
MIRAGRAGLRIAAYLTIVLPPNRRMISFLESSAPVFFRPLSDDQPTWYWAAPVRPASVLTDSIGAPFFQE